MSRSSETSDVVEEGEINDLKSKRYLDWCAVDNAFAPLEEPLSPDDLKLDKAEIVCL